MDSLYAGVPKNAFSQQRANLPNLFDNTVEINSVDLVTSTVNPSLKIKSHTLTGHVLEIIDSAGTRNAYMNADGSISAVSFTVTGATINTISVNTIDEKTVGHGVDIETVHFEDGAISGCSTIKVDTIVENSGGHGVDIETVHFEDGAISGCSTLKVTNITGCTNIVATNGTFTNLNVSSSMTISGNILPGNTGTDFIGSDAKPWRGVYATSLYINDYDTDNNSGTNVRFVDLPYNNDNYNAMGLVINDGDGGTGKVHISTADVSSRKYKTNIEMVTNSDWLLNLDTVTFNMCGINKDLTPNNIFHETKHPGFIAEDVEKIADIPDFIVKYKNDEVFGIRYENIWPYTVHKIKEHHNKINKLGTYLESSDLLLKSLCCDYDGLASRIDSVSRKIESEDTVISREYNISLDSDGMPLHASVFTIDHNETGEYSITFDKAFIKPPFILTTVKSEYPLLSHVIVATVKKVVIGVCTLTGTPCDPELLYIKISEK